MAMGIIFIDVLLFLVEEDQRSLIDAQLGRKWLTKRSYWYFKNIARPRLQLEKVLTLQRDKELFEKRFSGLDLRWTKFLPPTRPAPRLAGGEQQTPPDFWKEFRRFFKLTAKERFHFAAPEPNSEEGAGYTWPLLTSKFVGRIGNFPLDFYSVNGNEFMYRKMYWGIVGPYLPMTNEFVIKYTDLQCIRWKATDALIFQYLYADERATL